MSMARKPTRISQVTTHKDSQCQEEDQEKSKEKGKEKGKKEGKDKQEEEIQCHHNKEDKNKAFQMSRSLVTC